MSKSEIRNSKVETNPNAENPKSKTAPHKSVSDILPFRIGPCFGFRISDFGFRPLTSLLVLLLALLVPVSANAAAPRPNILVILSDDMGFSDIGCYGSEIQTPNLDSLAKNGVRFTQFYNNARCCPTRASVMTGLYPHHAGIGHMTSDLGYDGYRGQLNRQCVTIPEVLRPAGYRTYVCGKWHVCRDIRADGDKSDWPVQRGFEKFYGTITGAGSYYDPTTLCRQNQFITPENDPDYKPDFFYYTDAITDNAVRFLRQHATDSPDQPFFMYVAFTAAHWPMQAKEQDIAKYRGKYDGGYEPIRKARLERARQLGLVPANCSLSPMAGNWDKVSDHAREARCMEVYAAMVDCMDQGIGRILAQLRQSGQLDNTLIMFLQDNGGCAEDLGHSRTSPAPANLKPFGPNDLQSHIWPPMQTRDGRPVRGGPGVMPGAADTYVSYGKAWANVSNTPFREYKHWVHEGGISTPLIVSWPKGIPASRRNKLESQPGHIIDVMATCVDVAGAPYPTERDGQRIKPLQGVSLVPALHHRSLRRPQPIFWEHESNRAVRDGDWKLVAMANEPWELYNMKSDRSELHDLAAKNPDKVWELSAQWDAFAARCDVLPMGAWKGTGAPQAQAQEPRNGQLRFDLKAGDKLAKGKTPVVAGRAFTITAKFDAAAPNGVLVAQGGTALGYALYFQDGKLRFDFRNKSEPASLSTANAVTGAHTATVRVEKTGAIKLLLDEQPVVEAKVDGLMPSQPVEGLQVGCDDGNPVGPYTTPNPFNGTIDFIRIELLE
jgi:arylsulfatase A-like enzyme